MVRAIVCNLALLDCGTSCGFEVLLHFLRKKRSAGEAIKSCKLSNVMRMRIHISRRLCRLKLALFSCAVLILRACSSKVIRKGCSPHSHPATSSKSVISNNIEGTTK